MTVRVRIAPSPTGNLHIGTARTAVFNWLFARHEAGHFILRVEDTDKERSRPEYTQNIQEGLSWLGMTWDEGPFFQSDRLELYREATKTLLARGLAYRCYTTPEELDEMRSAQKARGEAPRYDNRHRNLTRKQQAEYEAEGRSAVIRFKIDSDRQIAWQDLVRGKVVWQAKDLGGDMVIARAATEGNIGEPLYNLAVVLDDIDMKISHVIRGEDHIANTAKQILLYEAFEAEIPEFAHTPLILNQAGQKLSKRDGVTSISDFRDMGFVSEALANYMTLLGWSPPDNQEVFTLEEAARSFSFERVNKAGAKFDWDKLDWLNSQYLHKMDLAKLTILLIPYWQKAGYEFNPTEDRPWLEQITALIAPSLTRLTDAAPMTRVFFAEELEINEEGAKQLEKEGAVGAIEAIREALDSSEPLTEASAGAIIKQVVKRQKVKKGLVMRSLRVALTGDVHGPDLIQSWLILNQRGLDLTRLEKVLKTDVEEAPTLAENTFATDESDQAEQPEPSSVQPVPTPESPAKEVVSGADVVETSTPEVVVETPTAEPLASESVAETPTPEQETEQPESAAEITTPEQEQPESAAEMPTPEQEQPESAAEIPTPEQETDQPESAWVSLTAEPEESAQPTPEQQSEESQPETAAVSPTAQQETEQPESVAETPTAQQETEQPESVAETPTAQQEQSVSETVEEAPSLGQQLQAIWQKALPVLSDLPEYVTGFFGEYQKPLTAIGVILAALVGIKLSVAVLDTFNSMPLLAPLFELIGILYSGWFVYRYLLAANRRQELLETIKDLKQEIAGDKDSPE